MTRQTDVYEIGDDHNEGRHQTPAQGCGACFDDLRRGYDTRAGMITTLREKLRFRVNAVRILSKEKAKWHREKAALNRENHRLLQNAHRKTLRRMREAEGLVRTITENVNRSTLHDSVRTLVRVLNITGEMGLEREALAGKDALEAILSYVNAPQLVRPSAASAVPAVPAPLPDYGCAGVHRPKDG